MGFLIFLLPLLFAPSAYSCSITTCSNTTTTPIRFPFRVNHTQPENCGYLGFNLYCTDQGLTALKLPQSGQFLVRYINYRTQSIQLYDPKNCLPQRLLDGFDPSGSPFKADSYVNYTFLSCPTKFTDARFTVIDCLSNSTTSIMATSQSIFAHRVSNKSCKMIKTLSVPYSQPENDEGFTSSLSDDIWLSWDVPDCKDCEVKGGICGFQNNSREQIGCFYGAANPGDVQQTGDSKGRKVLKIIAFSISVPAIICGLFVGIYFCNIYLCNLAMTWARGQQQIAVTPQFPEEETPTGLDQATIDSYTQVVLGESRRIPGLNDGTCPICLSEFKAKETLRCIPNCQHCFHTECIDEWLRMNGTCPLCRISPAHHLEV